MQITVRNNTRKSLRNALHTSVFATVITFTAACASSKSSSEGETFRDDNVAMQSAYQFKDIHGEQLYAAKK